MQMSWLFLLVAACGSVHRLESNGAVDSICPVHALFQWSVDPGRALHRGLQTGSGSCCAVWVLVVQQRCPAPIIGCCTLKAACHQNRSQFKACFPHFLAM
jgi:hypothetical protein